MDSIQLFKTHSYPSAYFLSVLSQEEFGKATLLDDFVWHSTVEGRQGDEIEQDWLGQIYSHRTKQSLFVKNAMYELPISFLKSIEEGDLEEGKQASVYVGFEKRREIDSQFRTPFSVKKRKASAQITLVNDFLRVLSLGISKECYGWDNPAIEKMLNLEFFNRFSNLWTTQTPQAKRVIRRLMKA